VTHQAPPQIRLGIIGLGNMGSGHCRLLESIDNIQLAAVCDIDPLRLEKITSRYGCPGYASSSALLKARDCDAILVATPHYDHTTIGIAALKAGYHLLVEKPISVHKADCEKLIAAHKDEQQVFAAMFNQRTNRHYQHIKQLIDTGELGEIRRINWTITDWFRSQSYYASGGWRATWAGEGGGVLLNQCPHQLDLLQWLFGMPVALRAHGSVGKYHAIEVEDDITCVLEYANGATGVFITTTGEAPGINRLEIAAENGLLVYDAALGNISFVRNAKSVSDALRDNGPFEKPSTSLSLFDEPDLGRQHAEVLENFADAILYKLPVLARAEEGIRSVELANAMIYSALNATRVTLPLNARRYQNFLKRKIKASTFNKPEVTGSGDVADLSGTF
jgi:predicted dehydrogenase